ncbi:hypothetical protein FJZ22_02140 [Candidatus Pacearchaeota archaeon]|nr:hypothetical protein [Candidatus Pacearchaeota archaeon]
MKRVVPFILCIVLLIPLTYAAELPFQDKVDKVDTTLNKLNDEQARDEYLKEQWVDFLNKSTAGKYIREAERQLTSLNFLWKFLLGIPFSWSFLFLFSFIIWLSLGTWIKRLLAFLELWDPKLHWILGFATATLASALGVERTIASWGVGLTQGFNILGINPLIVQLILQIALIIGVMYIGMFTSVWEKAFVAIKEKWEYNQMKKEVQELKKDKQERNTQLPRKKGGGFDYTGYDIT